MEENSAAAEDKPTQGRRANTAVRILDAAEQIYADYGYEGTSLRQIAEAVGIKEPSLYKHFAGKDAIYNAVIERTVRPLIDAMEQWFDKDITLSEVMDVPERMMQLLAEHPHGVRLLHRELSTSGTGMNPIAKEWFSKLLNSTTQFGVSIRGSEVVDDAEKEKIREDAVLTFLAMLNICIGYFNCVPFMEMLGGQNLLSEDMIQRQSKLFGELFKGLLFHPAGE